MDKEVLEPLARRAGFPDWAFDAVRGGRPTFVDPPEGHDVMVWAHDLGRTGSKQQWQFSFPATGPVPVVGETFQQGGRWYRVVRVEGPKP